MRLLTPKYISMRSFPKRKFDGWLFCGIRWRVKSYGKTLLVKPSVSSPWLSVTHVGRKGQLLCPWCGSRDDLLYLTDQTFRCRNCTLHLMGKPKSQKGLVKARNQLDVGDLATVAEWMIGTTDQRIAMRLVLEERNHVPKLLTPITEEEAINAVRYEPIDRYLIELDPIKPGRISWVLGKYICRIG